MDPQLKRRLVGTVIIVSLVVIFVPMLFEDKDDLSQDSGETHIPEFPKDFDSQVIPLPETAPGAKNPSGTDMDAQSAGRSPSGKDAASKSAQEAGPESPAAPAVPLAARRHDTLDPLDVPPGKPREAGEDEMAAPKPGATDGAEEEGLPAQPAKPPVTPLKPAQAPVTPAAKPAAKIAAEAAAKPGKSASELAPSPVKPGQKEAAAPPPLAKPVKKKTLTTTALPKPPAPETKAAPLAPLLAAKPAPPPPAPAPVAAGAAKEPASLSWWMIQAGSFDDEANAKNLKTRLLQAKIPAFSEKITAPNGVVKYRVRVGPEKERAKAEETLKRMESEAGVKGMIVSYP